MCNFTYLFLHQCIQVHSCNITFWLWLTIIMIIIFFMHDSFAWNFLLVLCFLLAFLFFELCLSYNASNVSFNNCLSHCTSCRSMTTKSMNWSLGFSLLGLIYMSGYLRCNTCLFVFQTTNPQLTLQYGVCYMEQYGMHKSIWYQKQILHKGKGKIECWLAYIYFVKCNEYGVKVLQN